jgi:hypothetical protein
MPSATLDALALRSTNPVKRAMDVICVVMLQLLTLMVVAAEQNPHKLRNHRFLGPHSILARLQAGETFDLPLLLIATIRDVASHLRTELRLDGLMIEPSGAPIPAEPQTPAAPAKATRQRAAHGQVLRTAPDRAPHALQTIKLPGQAALSGFAKQQALPPKVYPRPFRYDIGTSPAPYTQHPPPHAIPIAYRIASPHDRPHRTSGTLMSLRPRARARRLAQQRPH